MEKFIDAVFDIVRQIPEGKVTTYGDIAQAIGRPNASRAIGSTLHKNPNQEFYPCHRVVNSKGALAKNFAFGGIEAQKKLLEKEGVEVSDNYTVCLEAYCHSFVKKM